MNKISKKYFRVLTIAGSDSGGGAGIQADLKTFSALSCYGLSVLTALTAQNTLKVASICSVPASFIKEQLDAVLSDIGVDAVKVGMLHTPEVIQTVTDQLKSFRISTIVVDPVMIAKSGDRLLQREAVDALKELLFPLAKVITPNIPEAEYLLNVTIQTKDQIQKAAKDLLNFGCETVVLKGGHSHGENCEDYVISEKLAIENWLTAPRIITKNNHGTGCTFSSAIAAFLAQGDDTLLAIEKAKTYLNQAIEIGANFSLGSGHGPVHHFHNFWSRSNT